MRLPVPPVLLPVLLPGLRTALAERRAHRRLLRVEADPTLVVLSDVTLLLLAHGADPGDAARTTHRAGRLGLEPALLWEWVLAFDGHELVRLFCSASPNYLVESAVVDGITIHRELSRTEPG